MLDFLIASSLSRAVGNEEKITPRRPEKRPGGLTSAEFEAVDDRLEALKLACAAMWSLLKEKYGLTDEELTQRIHEIDAADGKVDGRIAFADVCPSCGRKLLLRTRRICVWCGAAVQAGDPF